MTPSRTPNRFKASSSSFSSSTSSKLIVGLIVIAFAWVLLLFYIIGLGGGDGNGSSGASGLRINNIISYVDSKIHGSVNIQYKGFHNSNSISSNSIRSDSISSNSISSNSIRSNSISSSSNSNGISSYKGKDDVVLVPKRYNIVDNSDSSIPIEEVRKNLTLYLHTLHTRLGALAGPHADAVEVWETYLDVTRNMVMKWDDENKHRFPKPRDDGSIFVSLGTYRDPYCPMTIKSLYKNAKSPDKLYVGLLQQNCFEKVCRTGVLVGGKVEDTSTDVDCYIEFCKSEEGINSGACNDGRVRLFNVNESESLGPYMARYIGARFYRGEQYYLQIDSHSEFVEDWDDKLINMVQSAEAKKPVISTYPPDSQMNWKNSIGYRMCDSEFAEAQIEWQIVRLSPSTAFDKMIPKKPRYAPFIAAGFIFAPANFLHEVPFDPFLPWIFMGEEISMSARLWTAGYDIFSPTINVLNHYYVRRHYPKFWESVNRFFKAPIHNDLVELVIKRVKCMLNYPESRADRISPASLLYRLEEWGMGGKRSFNDYMEMVGLNTLTKVVTPNMWCRKGEYPPQFLPYKLIK